MRKEYFAISIRENGRLLGRLTPTGHANRLNIYAAMLTHSRATDIAADINRAGTFTAKVIPF